MSKTFKDMPARFRKDIPMEADHDLHCENYSPDRYNYMRLRRKAIRREIREIGERFAKVAHVRMVDENGHHFTVLLKLKPGYGPRRYNTYLPDEDTPYYSEYGFGMTTKDIRSMFDLEYDKERHPNATFIMVEDSYQTYGRDKFGRDYVETIHYTRPDTYLAHAFVPVYEEITYSEPDDTVYECDLGSGARDARCTYQPVHIRSYYFYYGPYNTKKERHTGYWTPERANHRAQCREAMREYNAYGEVDTVVDTYQHRHAMYNGGWWD